MDSVQYQQANHLEAVIAIDQRFFTLSKVYLNPPTQPPVADKTSQKIRKIPWDPEIIKRR